MEVRSKIPFFIESVKITLPVGEYTIKRSYENLEIAYRIYIELITRKVAIPIDEENDVIKEVYGSWYEFFKTTRNEVKKLPGTMLTKNTQAAALIKLTCDILNKGLRPHLTEHQAAFQKWYAQELKNPDNDGKTPQQIQQTYYINEKLNFKKLVESMKGVNDLLIQYADKLKEFVHVGNNS